ncbi:methyl-accepting chemotaxis protein [Pseudoalteromonas phenolica]|uniref:methyl-accepting chemotaxis protein n=1 Tax=Pseudoalteromonas phenolica TaxID=161398 RepID=UPI00384EC7CB
MDTATHSSGIFKTLKAKLISAFTVMLIILAAIGLTAYWALKSADEGFNSYRELARDSNLASTLQSNMLMVRMNVKDFLLTGSNQDIQEYGQYFNEVERLLNTAKDEINKPERARIVTQLIEEIQQYNASFEIIKSYRVQRDDLVFNQLDVIGPQLERSLTQVMQDAAKANNSQLAFDSGEALRHLLLGRLYVIKYLESNDIEAFDRVKTEFALLEDQLIIINALNLNATNQQTIEKLTRQKTQYLTAFNDVQTIIQDRNNLVSNVLDVVGPHFAKLVKELSLSVKADQDTLGPKLKASNEQAVSQIFIMFMTALIISAAIIFFLLRMVMKQLGKDPSELDNIATAISEGNLDQEYDERAPQGVFKSMLEMRESLKLIREKEEQERRVARVNARIKSALDNANSNVMITNTDHQVIYLNSSIQHMFEGVETQLQAELPNFSAHHILNAQINGLMPYFEQHLAQIESLTTSLEEQFVIAGRTFKLVASPVIVESQRVGTVFEWQDRTEELAAAEEKARIASENARVKYALDGSSGQVMIADKDLNVIYMNNAIHDMFKVASQDIKQAIPHFNHEAIIGNRVDAFFEHFSDKVEDFKTQTASIETEFVISGRTFTVIVSPVSVEGERVGTVLEWQDRTDWLAQEREKTRIAAENARVRYALDSVSGNVMIADKNLNIIYANQALKSTIESAERDIQAHIGQFDASSLIGFPVDQFYLEPEQQRVLFNNLSHAHNSTEYIGERVFSVTSNPIFVNNERIGTVLEWTDRTAEVNIEKEIDNLVQSAAQGDLSQKLSLQGKTGFFEKLSTGLNDLVSTVEVALDDVTKVLSALAQGDLSKRITNDYEGSFGQLKQDTNSTADKLTEVIENITHASGSISQGANEIAQGNADLSQRTEEQASSLEETSASMDEVTEIVRQSSERAENANTLSMTAEDKATQGGEVVKLAVDAMREINQSSKQITEIISVIDEIAFQTNLLALNAAVEAARAGEQGRGFAVVAGEVRSLAQRSSNAAREIKDLIRDSQSKVEEGTDLVNRSGETLSEIVEATSKVRVMMAEIAQSARHQSESIMQINTAINQMDQMTQQNAALVEEAAAAGEAMAEQAQMMNQTVEFFSLTESRTSSPALEQTFLPDERYLPSLA